MSTSTCPKCNSTDIVSERRLYRPDDDRNVTVGQWRVGCGVTATVIVLIVGGVAAYLAMTLNDATFAQLALVLAVICGVFAANSLGMSIYLWQWSPVSRYRCEACQHEWADEHAAPEQTQEPNPL